MLGIMTLKSYGVTLSTVCLFLWIFAMTGSCFWRDLPIVYLPSKNPLGFSISIFSSYSLKIKSKAVVAFKVNSMFIALKYLQVSNPIQNLLFLYHRVHKQNHFIPFDISQVLSKPNFTARVLHVKSNSITWFISALFYFNINAWSLKLYTFFAEFVCAGFIRIIYFTTQP